jgi:type I restriction enzyme S subunit
MVGSSGFCVLRAEAVNPKLVLYYVLSNAFTRFILPKVTGASYPAVTEQDVKGAIIPVPPMDVQKQIVAELEKINEVIADNREMLNKLNELQQSIFYDMFGDPVTNPQHFELTNLEKCVPENCSISYGIVQPGDEVLDGVPIVRPVDFTADRIVKFDGLKKISPSIAQQYQRTVLAGGEILICVRGTTGIVKIADQSLCGANVTRGIVPLTFNNRVNSTYAFEYLKSNNAQEFIAFKTKGTALKQINISDLKQLPIILPPLPLQEEFAAKIEAIEAQKANIEETIRKMQTLLDSRMDYWFN